MHKGSAEVHETLQMPLVTGCSKKRPRGCNCQGMPCLRMPASKAYARPAELAAFAASYEQGAAGR